MPPPPSKKRKAAPVEEISFNEAAREDYLTGFHKRKQARIKHAQEEAAKKEEREERIRERKKMRDERKADLEKHVEAVNALLRKAHEDLDDNEDGEGEEEWEGIEEAQVLDHEDEYVDEDRYTTVTVESVDISRDGFHRAGDASEDEEQHDSEPKSNQGKQEAGVKAGAGIERLSSGKKRIWTKERPKGDKPKKKKKFRYESPAERKLTRVKERSKNKAQAKARRSN